MPRQRRFILPHIPHHAIQRGNNRQEIFFDEEDRCYYLVQLCGASYRCSTKIGAYCLMTNHVHLLLYPETVAGLIGMMKSVSQHYSQYMNRKYGRSGKLWDNRYKLHLVDPESVWAVSRYIEKNPIRAGIVKEAADYTYSSARAHLKGIDDRLLNQDIVGNRQAAYREFFIEDAWKEAQTLREIRDVAQQEKVFGGLEFFEKVENLFQEC